MPIDIVPNFLGTDNTQILVLVSAHSLSKKLLNLPCTKTEIEGPKKCEHWSKIAKRKYRFTTAIVFRQYGFEILVKSARSDWWCPMQFSVRLLQYC